MADGPVIQRVERARARSTASALTRRARDASPSSARPTTTTPVVLMGYANPIEAMGHERLRRRRAGAPASTACWSSTIRRRKRRPLAELLDARGIDADLPAVADVDRRRASSEVARYGARLRLLRLAEGRDRRRATSTSRTSRQSSRSDPRSISSCRSASASASAMPQTARAVAAVADAVVIGSRAGAGDRTSPRERGVGQRRRVLVKRYPRCARHA